MLVPLKLLQDQPLQQQLYDQLRHLIVSGRLLPGARMPSTRMLSDQFAVSRITVVLAYERLVAEGYLQTHPASGTFVGAMPSGQAAPPAEPCGAAKPIERVPPPADAAIGRPDPLLFPFGRWRAFMRRALDRFGANLGADHPGGVPALRRAIANWLAATRGLTVSPEQIFVVGSRRRAVELAAHLLLRPGQRVVVEAPCDETIASVYAGAAARLVRIPVDGDGLRTDRLPSRAVALAHVTPAHQRPLGMVLSAPRRQGLIDWAMRTDATIVEEDCDGDFRYAPASVPPLMSRDDNDRVVYVGGFAATLGLGVSLAYLVAPERLIGPALSARPLIDERAGWIEETALADFIDSGSYARHVHRLRKIYAGRRIALIESLKHYFGAAAVHGSQTGLDLAWTPPPAIGSATALAAAARQCGIGARVLPRTAGVRRELADRVVLFGYAASSERQIREAMAQFATAVRAIRPQPGTLQATGD